MGAGARQQSYHPTARPQRHDDHRVHVQRAAQRALPIVRALREVRLVHGHQLGHARHEEVLVEAAGRVQLPHDLLVFGAGGGHGHGARPAGPHLEQPAHLDEPLAHQRAQEHVAARGHGRLGVHRRADRVDEPPAFPLAVAVVDVHAAADVGAVVERGAAVQHPAVSAVGPTQAVLQFERLTRGDRGRADRSAALCVVGVHAGPPAVAEVVVGTRAGELEPGPIDQRAAFGGIDPDQRGGGVGEGLEPGWSVAGWQQSHTRLVLRALRQGDPV